MRVLMFGWEFPPLSSGGLGTACYGLTKSLAKKGVNITFVMPYASDEVHDFLNLVPAKVSIRNIDSILDPYMNPRSYKQKFYEREKKGPIYGKFLFEEVRRYAELAKQIAIEEEFDIIHCHDWMTFQAGINAKQIKHKPLVVHVHATEFDRTGGHGVNQPVYDLERYGMEQADIILPVSNYTKNLIMKHYGIAEHKMRVVHNAVEQKDTQRFQINKQDKVVLFLGRLTLQKGPDYFLYAAKRVLDIMPDVKFIIAGTGDMERFIIEKTAELGISHKVLFAGFLQNDDVQRAYQMADLYVMPSVSEPFGLTALEAMQSGTPILISKQSGVSEVITNCLKADFWDVNDLANKMGAALRYKVLHDTLKEHGDLEIRKFSWDDPADKCIDVYNKLTLREIIR